MKITLVQCPAWTIESPPYALALLAAALKKSGHEVSCFDLNIELFQYCKSKFSHNDSIINAESWSCDYRGDVWYDRDVVAGFIKKNPGYIDRLLLSIVETSAEVIGFSVQSTSKFFSLELSRKIKEKSKNKIIVFGGFLCSRNCYGIDILRDYPFLDYVCFREGEESFVSLINVIEKKGHNLPVIGFGYRNSDGVISDGGEGPLIKDLDKIPFAEFSQFSLNKYTKKLLPIAASRGCLNNCSFCDQSSHWGKYRSRSAQNIVSEIAFQLKNYPDIKQFFFNDYLINGNLKTLNELCDLIIANNMDINWCSYAVIRREMDNYLLHKMKLAGCNSLIYGVESGSNRVLKLMKKGYTAELAEQILRSTFESGICADFNIIVGFPGETELDFRETIEFVRRCNKYAGHIDLHTCLVLKGSHLFLHSELFKISPINYNTDWQLKWETRDGLNTYDIRMKRLSEVNGLISDKNKSVI